MVPPNHPTRWPPLPRGSLLASPDSPSECASPARRSSDKPPLAPSPTRQGKWGSSTAWWYTYPSEKYKFVGWDDDIRNIWKTKKSKPPTSMVISCHFSTSTEVGHRWSLRMLINAYKCCKCEIKFVLFWSFWTSKKRIWVSDDISPILLSWVI